MAAKDFNTGFEIEHYGKDFFDRLEAGETCYIDIQDLGHFLAPCKIDSIEAFNDYERHEKPVITAPEHFPENVMRIKAINGEKHLEFEVKIATRRKDEPGYYPEPFFEVYMKNQWTNDADY